MRNKIPLLGKVLHTFKMDTRKMQPTRFDERGDVLKEGTQIGWDL